MNRNEAIKLLTLTIVGLLMYYGLVDPVNEVIHNFAIFYVWLRIITMVVLLSIPLAFEEALRKNMRKSKRFSQLYLITHWVIGLTLIGVGNLITAGIYTVVAIPYIQMIGHTRNKINEGEI
jgi:hypothetical protein